ncbi:unnamed protein product [Gordionus sp. m RMFG-2023]|uniref:LLGL scribble cell polarity complex component 2-like n=1 Tax=Gordionus sp. m RMFG-2023 TaxID=3053472 RepID=UPI0030E0793E
MSQFIKLIKHKSNLLEFERNRIQNELFLFPNEGSIGYLSKPYIIVSDHILNLIGIGTKFGNIQICGSPGVEYNGMLTSENGINHMFFIPGKGRIIVISEDEVINLYEFYQDNFIGKIRLLNSFNIKNSIMINKNSATIMKNYKNSNNFIISAIGKTDDLITLKEIFYIGTPSGDLHSFNIDTFQINSKNFIMSKSSFQKILNSHKNIDKSSSSVIKNIIPLNHLDNSNQALLLVGLKKYFILVCDFAQQKILFYFEHEKEIEDISLHHSTLHQKKFPEFVSSHQDGSLLIWEYDSESANQLLSHVNQKLFPENLNERNEECEDLITSLQIDQSPIKICFNKNGIYPFGTKNNKPITKVLWKDSGLLRPNESFLIFLGGMPKDGDHVDKYTLTILKAESPASKKEADDYINIVNNDCKKITTSLQNIFEVTNKIEDFLFLDINNKGEYLFILAEEEWIALVNKILTNPDLPEKKNEEIKYSSISLKNESSEIAKSETHFRPIQTPYMTCLHRSAITACHMVDDPLFCNRIAKEFAHLGTEPLSEWPIYGTYDFCHSISFYSDKGGKDGIKILDPIKGQHDYQICITGHEDGSVRFWLLFTTLPNVSLLISTLYTAHFIPSFPGPSHIPEPEKLLFEKSELRIDPIGLFDPFSDDPRLAIHKFELLPNSEKTKWSFAIGGAAGQCFVISDLFKLLSLNAGAHFDGEEVNDDRAHIEYHWIKADLVDERAQNFVWKGHTSLYHINMTAKPLLPSIVSGIVVSCCQIWPPAAITTLSLCPSMGLICTGTAHGFTCWDYNNPTGTALFCRTTLSLSNDMITGGDSALSMKKSLKKSLRQSFRRLRRLRKEIPIIPNEQDKIADNPNLAPLTRQFSARKRINKNSSLNNTSISKVDSENLSRKGSKWLDSGEERCIKARPTLFLPKNVVEDLSNIVKTPIKSSKIFNETENDKKSGNLELPIFDNKSRGVIPPSNLKNSSPKFNREVSNDNKGESLSTANSGLVKCAHFWKGAVAALASLPNSSRPIQQVTTLWVGTNSGRIFVYMIESLWDNDSSQGNKTLTYKALKEIQLKHGAPVIHIRVIESNSNHNSHHHNGRSLSNSMNEAMTEYRLLVASEEQIKTFYLPTLKPCHKYRLTAMEGSLIRRIFSFVATKTPTTNNSQNLDNQLDRFQVIAALTNHGEIAIFESTNLKRLFFKGLLRKEDINGIYSLSVLNAGQGFYLDSSKELRRFCLSRHYHTRCIERKKKYFTAQNVATEGKDVREERDTVEFDFAVFYEREMDIINKTKTSKSLYSQFMKGRKRQGVEKNGVCDNSNNINKIVNSDKELKRAGSYSKLEATTGDNNLLAPVLFEAEDDSFYRDARSICQKSSLAELKKSILKNHVNSAINNDSPIAEISNHVSATHI